MEQAIRWNHRSTPSDPSFLLVDVPGRSFKHCRVDGHKGASIQWREISKISRLPQFRAFDWHFSQNLIAIGQWSGEVTVLGLKNGLTSVSMPLKTHRACNSVAFSSESLLATGLDRVRNDFCLNVYDVGQLGGNTCSSPALRQATTEPLRRLAVSESITSIKFFSQQPNILVTGIKGIGVRIYDLRDDHSNPAVQFNTSCIHNIAVDPSNGHHFASAGPAKDGTVHIWDHRSAGRQALSSTGQDPTYDTPLLELRDIFKPQLNGEPSSVWSLRYSIAEPGALGVLSNFGEVRVFDTKQDWIEPEYKRSGSIGDPCSPISVSRTRNLSSPESLSISAMDRPGVDNRVLAFDFVNLLGPNSRPAAVTINGKQEVEISELRSTGPVLAMRFAARARIALGQSSHESKIGMKIFEASQAGTISDALRAVNERLGRQINQAVANGIEDENENDGWMATQKEPISRPHSRPSSRAAQRRSEGQPRGTVEDALTIADRTRRRCVEGYMLDARRNADIVKGNQELELMWDWIAIAREHAENGSLSSGPINYNYLGVYNIWNENIGSDETSRVRPGTIKLDLPNRIIRHVRDLGLENVEIPETAKAYHRWLSLYILGFDSRPDALLQRVKELALAGRNAEAALHALLSRDNNLASIALRSGPRSTQHKALSLLLSVYVRTEDKATLLQDLNEIVATDTEPYIVAIKHLLTIRMTETEPSSVPPIPYLPPRYHIALALSVLLDGPLKIYLLEKYREAVGGGLLSIIPLTGLSQLSLRIFKRYLTNTGDLQTVVLALSHVCPLYFNKPRMMSWQTEYRSQLNRYRLFIKRAQFHVEATKLAMKPDGTTALEAPKRQISLKCANCDNALHRDPDSSDRGTGDTQLPMTPTTLSNTGQPPTLQTSTSDPTIASINSTSMDSLAPFSFDSPSSQQMNLAPPTANNGGGLSSPSTTGAARGSGFRTPTTPIPPLTPGAATATSTAASVKRLFPPPRDGTICPHCGARMPRCAVCEFWLGETDPRSRGARSAVAGITDAIVTGTTVNTGGRSVSGGSANGTTHGGKTAGDVAGVSSVSATSAAAIRKEVAGVDDPLTGFVEVCLRCKHVYHHGHAMAWFAKHVQCAAVDCGCSCGFDDSVAPTAGLAQQGDRAAIVAVR